METYETYEWFEQCRVLPNIKSTSLPKRINVTIQDFDFEGRAVGELTSLDEMRLNMTERWVSHFHDALLNKYQGQGSSTNETVSTAQTIRAVNRSPMKAYTKLWRKMPTQVYSMDVMTLICTKARYKWGALYINT